MEKSDAHRARSGISEELLKEIDAQYAIINSAVKLINQQAQATNTEQDSNKNSGELVYNMDGLQNWVHHYTKRKQLNCPHCNYPRIVKCKVCGEEYEYHDEL